jgi:tryptophanase
MTLENTQLKVELSDRERILEQFGYNVVNIHPSLVEFDLMTDSWNELASPEIAARMASLLAQVDFSDPHTHARDVFPFQHFVNVSQGRAAEAWFWKSAAKKDKKVIQNLLFPTTRHHVVANRMTPVEMPVDHVFDRHSTDLFRGNLDCEKLKTLISTEGGADIAYLYIEAENNASGGYPVSMANVREIRSVIAGHDIQMVLDATRLVENAVLIQKHEPGYADKSVRDIVHEFCGYFDSMTCSLAKDFGINRGGLIATNNERLHFRAIDTVATYGPGINVTDKATINAALKDWDFVEQAGKRRVEQARRLHAAVVAAGLPLITPAPGHCLLFDAADYIDVKQYKNPIAAFVAAIFARAGVRGGMHVSGMMREYAKPSFVRFAIPLCTPDSKIDALTEPFIAALKSLRDIPDLVKTSNIPGIYGQMHALYKPA